MLNSISCFELVFTLQTEHCNIIS